jgi:hypothetical protein
MLARASGNLLDRPSSYVEHKRKKMSTCNVSVGKLDVKRPLGRSRHRWEDNIKIDLKEIEWECVN